MPPTYPSAFRRLEKISYISAFGQPVFDRRSADHHQFPSEKRPSFHLECRIFPGEGTHLFLLEKGYISQTDGRTIILHRQGRIFWMKAGGVEGSAPVQTHRMPRVVELNDHFRSGGTHSNDLIIRPF